ncbi:MAG: transporter ATP-binding protein [Devosia sp.]|uniref:ABC transporter ATP-binding protein n=1 Tax=Devosia sp. TaxID=1871048 RepID=UPI0026074819|nr:ABC transporter ATP-binding protein [Devosia sp.]MDB5539209.1 transporter ATP-binding protein [Devosia sp.]
MTTLTNAGPRLEIAIEAKDFDSLAEPLLSRFQLTIEPSSVVALVGPSGVGKSTLLRMIGGIDTGFSGSVLVDGVPASEAPPAGFVFQDARLLPWLTALDNIRAVRPETSEAEATTMLMRVGLSGYAHAYPHELSGGMQRRVALARAFSVNPRLLLLDEPFVSLDRTLVQEMEQVLLSLIETSRPTVLLVTHLPEDAAMLADRALVLAGRPARIVADYRFAAPPGQRPRIEREHIANQIASAAEIPARAAT